MARVKTVFGYFYTGRADRRWKNVVQRDQQVPFRDWGIEAH
jgi:hypothetical protein